MNALLMQQDSHMKLVLMYYNYQKIREHRGSVFGQQSILDGQQKVVLTLLP